ncbi:hypothetical protein HMPREF9554_02540 [Treponema phagedenis F0421]|nr:hypothetical protein HMPREF9554_02540 [Treponema phagedenis F0421]
MDFDIIRQGNGLFMLGLTHEKNNRKGGRPYVKMYRDSFRITP